MTDSPRIEKAPDAFRTISEVSEALDVPQHVLRFWEAKFPQVKPLKRAGGRRYYRPDDSDLLKGIRALLYGEGLTIKGVQKVLREQGVRHVAEIGRDGVKDATARREAEKAAPVVLPTVEQVNLSAEAPSDTLIEAQRARLENVLDELLNLREMLRRRPQFSQRKLSAAE
ncbi:MAG: MerR family transcriptional regulator [Alphaproteobacteria bacterium]